MDDFERWWSERRPQLRQRPAADGLRKLVRAVLPGAEVVSVRRLGGGLGAATHLVTLQRRARRSELVVKRFLEGGPRARLEWRRTVFAERLPGRPDLTFTTAERNYELIAEAILAIASTSTARLPADMRERIPGRDFEPHPDLRRTPLVEDAIAAARARRAAIRKLPLVVGHGDIHPGNMLWSRGKLSGLVDWGACGLQFLTREVVYCRTELSVLFGLRAADAFTETFERLSGRPLDELRAFDLMQGLTAMRWVRWWAHAYREQGRTDLTDETAQRRARAFLDRAVRG
jgi:hypothetical protein